MFLGIARNHIGLAAALLVAPAIGSADVVFDRNAIMLTTVSNQNSFAQARFAAITQLADDIDDSRVFGGVIAKPDN